jgi:hypothetical protein
MHDLSSTKSGDEATSFSQLARVIHDMPKNIAKQKNLVLCAKKNQKFYYSKESHKKNCNKPAKRNQKERSKGFPNTPPTNSVSQQCGSVMEGSGTVMSRGMKEAVISVDPLNIDPNKKKDVGSHADQVFRQL